MLRRTGIITPLCQSSLSALLSSACAQAARVSVNLQCYRFKAWHAYRHIDIDAVRVERQGVTAGMGVRVHDFRHRPAVSSSTSVHNSADKRGRTAESVSHATTHATSHDMQTGHRRRRVSPPDKDVHVPRRHEARIDRRVPTLPATHASQPRAASVHCHMRKRSP